jgi:hypothetical protein
VDPKLMMIIASFIGALAGIFFIMVAKPVYDYFVWLTLFAIIGIGVGNLALLILYKTNEWIKTGRCKKEAAQIHKEYNYQQK